MLAFCLFVATTSFVYGADNNYTNLNVDLPIPLAEPITAIYNDHLYVFGGKNTSFNTQFWKLTLSSIQLSGTQDSVTTSLTSDSWQEITVTAPDYGPASGNNEFACLGQCSAVIGKYLYIVGSYSSGQNVNLPETNTVYKLDLETMTFESESSFPSTKGFGTAKYGECVTAINNVLYTVTGEDQYATVSYNPSTNTLRNICNFIFFIFIFSSSVVSQCDFAY